MKLKLFIDRPILACVVSVLILLVGLIGLVNLPMEQYPDIAPPTVMVSATYTGANAETVQKSVVVPLEEAINGVEDMLYMTLLSILNKELIRTWPPSTPRTASARPRDCCPPR